MTGLFLALLLLIGVAFGVVVWVLGRALRHNNRKDVR